jgi:hypothetical protein
VSAYFPAAARCARSACSLFSARSASRGVIVSPGMRIAPYTTAASVAPARVVESEETEALAITCRQLQVLRMNLLIAHAKRNKEDTRFQFKCAEVYQNSFRHLGSLSVRDFVRKHFVGPESAPVPAATAATAAPITVQNLYPSKTRNGVCRRPRQARKNHLQLESI